MERRASARGPVEQAARKPRPERRDAHPVLELQRSAGNAAVVQAVQRSSLWERAKEAVGAEDKSAVEISADDMNEQLEKVIDKLEKAQKVLPDGQLKEGCEGVANGLGKVKGPIEKMLKYQELARDLRKFYRALQKLESIDIRSDYEGGADAFSDLAEVAGKLGGKVVPAQVGFVGPYFQLIEGSGAIFKMGARLRKSREAQLDPEKYYEDKQREWDRDAAREQAKRAAAAHHEAPAAELPFDALWGDILMKINRVRRAGRLHEWRAIEHKRDDLRATMTRIAQGRKELAAKHFWEDKKALKLRLYGDYIEAAIKVDSLSTSFVLSGAVGREFDLEPDKRALEHERDAVRR